MAKNGQEAVVRVPDGMTIDSPIELGLEASGSDEPITLTVQAGEKSCATILLRLEGGAAKSLRINLSVVVGKKSNIRIVEIQNLPSSTDYVAFRKSDVGTGATLDQILIQLGAQTGSSTLDQTTRGSNATLNAHALFIARKKPHHSFKLNQVANHSNSTVKSVLKSIASDIGTVYAEGRILIPKNTHGIEGHLQLDGLLLSRDAHICFVPALEINTNDVKVGHGASVSNLNEENLFYLTSRGLDPDEARRLMVRGFVSDVTDRLADLPELRDEVMSLI